MPDFYTKAVLTVIAVSLSAIASQGSPITRVRADTAGCNDYNNPCYVELRTGHNIPIVIKNWPDK